MRYEVEQKYRLTDAPALERALDELNVRWRPAAAQVDVYFAHPCRDFAQSDEALRLRCVGELAFVTYKGPKVGTIAKTRRELELPLAGGRHGAAPFEEMLELLGFRRVAEVVKSRRPGELVWRGQPLEVALDEVRGIGAFLEIELFADDASRSAAESTVQSLAQALGLTNQEKSSYLALVLAQTAP